MFNINDILSESRPALPVGRYIYFLIDNYEIVYVGQSTNMYYRFMCHGTYGKKFNRVSWIDIGDQDLDTIEADYIIKFNPKYNKIVPICEKYTRNTYVSDLKIRSEIENILTPLYSFSRKYSTGIINIHVYHTEEFQDALSKLWNN